MSDGAMLERRCRCGWRRPLIALTSLKGHIPEDTFPVYRCPQCGDVHVPKNIDAETAARVVDELERSLRAFAFMKPS